MPFTLGQSIALTTDVDNDGVVDPGETVTVTLTLGTGATGGTGVQLTIDLTGLTYVGGSLNISPLALDDAFTPFGNTPFTGSSLFANDFEFFGDTFSFQSLIGTPLATTQGGSITLNADGTFTYLSALGFTGTDTFTYTIKDAAGLTGSATVSFNVGPAIWYIDDTAGGTGGTGTKNDPFRTIADFNAANTGGPLKPDDNDIIYLRYGDNGIYSTADGINLRAGQQLIGQGENLTVTHPSGGAPVTLETGSALQTPTISVTDAGNQGVSLGAGNVLKGFDIATTLGSQTGIDDGNVNVGSLTISNVQVTGVGKAVDIDQGGALTVTLDKLTSTGSTTEGVDLGGGVTGTFNVTDVTSAISGSTGVAFNVGSGTASIDYNGTIAKTLDGRAIVVDGHTGGTVRFDGSVSSTSAADGVNLTGNTGASLFFTGGLTVTANSAGGTAFNASGGGTLSITGAANTINATGVTALTVDGVTIAAGGLNFQSISANGGTNGIVLNNTGGTAGLTVTGDGADAGTAPDSQTSGGTIQNMTGHGISLANTQNFYLGGVTITNNLGSGISGTTVTGFVLDTLNINDNGDDQLADESGVSIINLFGTASNGASPTIIRNSSFNSNLEFELLIQNSSGTLTNLLLSNNTFQSTGQTVNGAPTPVHGDLVQMQGTGTAIMGMTVTGGTYTGSYGIGPGLSGSGVFANAADTSNVTLNVTGATFNRNNVGLNASIEDSATLTFNFTNNIVTNSRSHAINHFSNGNGPFNRTTNGTISGNTVGNGATNSGSELGIGIRIQNEGATNGTFLIENNLVQDVKDFQGVTVNVGLGGSVTGGGTTNLTIRNNQFIDIGSRAMAIQDNQTPSGPFPSINLSMSGNSFSNILGQAGNGQYFRVRELSGTVVVTQAQPTAAAVPAELDDANGFNDLTRMQLDGGIVYNGAAPPLPTTSPLPDADADASAGPPAAWTAVVEDQADPQIIPLDPETPITPEAKAVVPTIDVAAIERAILAALAGDQQVFNIPNLPANRTLSIVYRATVDNQGVDKFILPGSVMATITSSNATVSDTDAVAIDSLSLSGLIWGDTDRDGVLDGGETGVSGVTVELYADTDDSGGFSAGDVLLSTIVTGAVVSGANYNFTGLAPGDYFVRLTNGRGAFPLSGAGELDPDNNTDSDDNGFIDNGVVLSRTITLAYNTEPTNGAGNDANATLDFALAPGGTAGVDVLLGESGRDSIDGGASGDTINGAGGDDTLNGAGGNDTLIGGTGNDSLTGGQGDDRFEVDAAGDVVVELAGEGTADVIVSTVSYTIAAHVEAMRIEGAGLTGTGSAGADLLVSAGGANTLTGLGGDDVYVVNTAGDVVTEAAGGGVDVVVATVSYTLPANAELLVMRGAGLTGTGTAAADAFRGEGGPNTFVGLGGDDVYVLGNGGDVVTEAAGGGLDSVFSTFSHTLAAEVEQLFLTGTGLTGTGNASANLLSSAGGSNTLMGLGGDDIYVVNAAGDVVTEAAGEGYDLIVARHSRTIAANVEGLVVVGTGLTATGGGSGDLLISEGSGNTLTGGGGDDFLLAGTKSDALTGGIGGDAFAFRSLNGAVLADRFTITDFDAATGDGIDLRRIDADSAASGDQAFTIGTLANGQAGRLQIDQVSASLYRLSGDVDGDGVADFMLDITVASGGTWNAGNIFL